MKAGWMSTGVQQDEDGDIRIGFISEYGAGQSFFIEAAHVEELRKLLGVKSEKKKAPKRKRART